MELTESVQPGLSIQMVGVDGIHLHETDTYRRVN